MYIYFVKFSGFPTKRAKEIKEWMLERWENSKKKKKVMGRGERE